MYVTPSGKVRAHDLLAPPVRLLVVILCTTAVLGIFSADARAQSAFHAGPPTDSIWGPVGEAPPDVVAKANRLVSEVVEPEVALDLDPRRSKILRTTKPVSRISINNPGVVEIVQYGPTEFELIGGTTGQTVVTFWFGQEYEDREILRYMVRVEPNRTDDDRRRVEVKEIERMINELFPNSNLQLIPVADKVIVRGQARSTEEVGDIMMVLQSGGTGQATSGMGRGVLAQPYPGGIALPGISLINLLDVPGEKQVMLKVRIADLSRAAAREMGAELDMAWGDFAWNSALGAGGAFAAILDTTDVDLTIQALATNSYSKVLAEPNLVTISGQSASFLAGGEFAVPIVVGVEGAAASTTNFRGFGTQVSFTPTVMDKDRIRLQVTPTLSSLSGGSVNGIPSLNTRTVQTTVDLREGQWLAIAGLIQDEQTGSKVRVPFIGDVPYLDTIFSRRSISRNETEMVVLVSPELVHPLEPEDAPLILPGMEITEPSDWAFFFAGRYRGKDDCHHRSTIWPEWQRQILDARKDAKKMAHYRQCEDYYIQGDHGFSE